MTLQKYTNKVKNLVNNKTFYTKHKRHIHPTKHNRKKVYFANSQPKTITSITLSRRHEWLVRSCYRPLFVNVSRDVCVDDAKVAKAENS